MKKTFIILCLLGINKSAISQHKDLPVFNRNGQVALGQFFNFQTEQIVPLKLLNFTSTKTAVGKMELKYYLIENASQQYNAMGFGARVSYKSMFYNASASVSGGSNYRKDERVVTTALVYEYIDTIHSTNSQSSGIDFTDSAKKIISTYGYRAFESLYGPIYISDIAYGSRIAIFVTMTFSSVQEADQFKASLQANAQTGLSGSASYNSYAKSANASGYVNLSVSTQGVSHELKDVSNLLTGVNYNNFSGSISAIIDNYLKSVQPISIPLYATFSDAGILAGKPHMDFEDVTNRLIASINLYKLNERRINKANLYIKDPAYTVLFDPSVINALKVAKSNIVTSQDSLEKLIKNSIAYGFPISNSVFRGYDDSLNAEKSFIDTLYAPAKCEDTLQEFSTYTSGNGSIGYDKIELLRPLKGFPHKGNIIVNVSGIASVSPNVSNLNCGVKFKVFANGKEIKDIDLSHSISPYEGVTFATPIPAPYEDELNIYFVNNGSFAQTVGGGSSYLQYLRFHPTFKVWVTSKCDSVIPTFNNANFLGSGPLTTMEPPYFQPVNLSINNFNEADGSNFTILPNPATNAFTILSETSHKTKLTIYNMVGQLVYSDTYLPGQTEKIVDSSKFLKGIYIVRFGNLTQKVVIQ